MYKGGKYWFIVTLNIISHIGVFMYMFIVIISSQENVYFTFSMIE